MNIDEWALVGFVLLEDVLIHPAEVGLVQNVTKRSVFVIDAEVKLAEFSPEKPFLG
jgi:hypothetical protein